PGSAHRKCTACPRASTSGLKGGTAIRRALSVRSALWSRSKLDSSARIKKSMSLLTCAAPYNTQACPPISSAWTPFALIVERTCRIGVGIKATSHCKILREENFALPESLDWSQIDPFFPLIRHLLVSHAFQRYHFDSFLYNSLRRL